MVDTQLEGYLLKKIGASLKGKKKQHLQRSLKEKKIGSHMD
jgi:hypothetical protein